jgi:two-component system cell cycle sensor histidine kinase/response regulator CckA
MDETTRQHVFEPFFTTKGAAGTGLGLSNVFHIVKNLGGSISLRTGADCGTQFDIALPAVTSAARPEAMRAG